jgi:hypothetical protein
MTIRATSTTDRAIVSGMAPAVWHTTRSLSHAEGRLSGATFTVVDVEEGRDVRGMVTFHSRTRNGTEVPWHE